MPKVIAALIWAAEIIARCLPGIVFLLAACLTVLVWAGMDGIQDWRIRPPPGRRGRHDIKRTKRKEDYL